MMKRMSEAIVEQVEERRDPQQQKQVVPLLIMICSANRNIAAKIPKTQAALLGYSHAPFSFCPISSDCQCNISYIDVYTHVEKVSI